MYNVIGIEDVDYNNKSGKRVLGTRLYCTFDDLKIDGSGCEVFFIGQRVDLPPVSLGDNIQVFYNKYGSIDSVIVHPFNSNS